MPLIAMIIIVPKHVGLGIGRNPPTLSKTPPHPLARNAPSTRVGNPPNPGWVGWKGFGNYKQSSYSSYEGKVKSNTPRCPEWGPPTCVHSCLTNAYICCTQRMFVRAIIVIWIHFLTLYRTCWAPPRLDNPYSGTISPNPSCHSRNYSTQESAPKFGLWVIGLAATQVGGCAIL